MIRESISDTLNLPKDVLLGASLIHLTGHYELVIENYKNIIEYTSNVIIVQGRNVRIRITGDKLDIVYFTGEDMKVKGIFKEITFL